ncbi:hypothetical protein FQN54_000571 [Arachnomyces sp. PD_36]|nr:hypothetical protein FQN54_000571 [Arachnomyces sp. PD_36]
MWSLTSVFLATAGFSSLALGKPIFKRQDKTPVDAETYENLAYYAGFPIITGILANGTCASPSNDAELISYININSTDTQAALWKSPSTGEIIVGIPGTDSDIDSGTDFDFILTEYESLNIDCEDCKVHHGFLGAWNSLAPVLSEQLAAALEENPEYNTVISGHSLGGAIAAFAFASLKNGPYRVTSAYTYGQPRVGNSDFASYLNSISGANGTDPGILYRVTHDNDGIPQLPPTLFGYEHTSTEYWESEASPNQETTYQCEGNEPSDCNNSRPNLGGGDAHSSYAGMDEVTCS